jgi:hypothetical protein
MVKLLVEAFSMGWREVQAKGATAGVPALRVLKAGPSNNVDRQTTYILHSSLRVEYLCRMYSLHCLSVEQ